MNKATKLTKTKEFEQYKIDYKEDYDKFFTQLYLIGPIDLRGLRTIPLSIGTSKDPQKVLRELQNRSELKLTIYTITKPQPTRSALGVIKNIYKDRTEGFEWIDLDYDLLKDLRKYGLVKEYEGNALLKKLDKITKQSL